MKRVYSGRRHTPVAEIDWLNMMETKVNVRAYRFEEDPEVFSCLRQAADLIGEAAMLINRTDQQRQDYLAGEVSWKRRAIRAV